MNAYFLVKTLHVLSATILFGTGIGIAFFKWITDRSGDVRAIRVVSERVVLADWVFTTPAIVTQLATGIILANWLGHPLTTRWGGLALILFFIAGACWLPVVAIQLRLRELARMFTEDSVEPCAEYKGLSQIWFWLGIPAFSALVVVRWLMVAKPI